MRRSQPKRSKANASRSTISMPKAGPGASLRPTIMSAGCRPTRWPAGRAANAQSRGVADVGFSGPVDQSCRLSKRCRFGARLAVARIDGSHGGNDDRAATCRRRILRRSKITRPDFVAVAERFVGAPYLWGGKTVLGLDCSGLVQVALTACGVSCPRDSDMQEAALGTALDRVNGFADLQRGDLIFWKGHVAIVRDRTSLMHANAFHMAVAVEPIAEAVERIRAAGSEVTSMRRIG